MSHRRRGFNPHYPDFGFGVTEGGILRGTFELQKDEIDKTVVIRMMLNLPTRERLFVAVKRSQIKSLAEELDKLEDLGYDFVEIPEI